MSTEPQDQHDDDYQDWIDDLLRTSSAKASTPTTLLQSIETSIRHRRRRSLLWKSTATIAAAASIALLAIYQQQPAPVNVDRKVVSSPTNPDSTNSEPTVSEPPPIATFVARSDLLAIPLESNDPQITIIQIYPTRHTHRRRQREATLQAISDQLDSIKQFSTNGG